MQKSRMIERIESIALNYIEMDHKKKSNLISVEYMLLAIMKVIDKEDFPKEQLEKLPQADKDEILEGRVNLKLRKFTASREKVRSICKEPNYEANTFRKEIEQLAFSKAMEKGSSKITISFYIDAIFERPGKNLKQFISTSKDNNSMEKLDNLFRITKQKQQKKASISRQVIGQDEAVDSFVDGMINSVLFRKDDTKPRGIFVFAGPPGVGKTFLAETGAAEFGLKVKRFDMSEFANDEDGVFKLIGTDKSWRNGHVGELTSFVEECNELNNGCFLIFDEIEKACEGVKHLFLQILDAGRLKDFHTCRTVSFHNAYIVFTTNAGRSLYEDGKRISQKVPKELVIDALKKDINPKTRSSYFPNAILSRFESGYVVMFKHLSATNLVDIGMKEMKKSSYLFKRLYGLDVLLDETIPFLHLLRKGGECDARVFKSECKNFVQDNIVDLVNSVSEEKLREALSENNTIRFKVDDKSSEKLSELFGEQSTNESILLLSEEIDYLEELYDCFRDSEYRIDVQKSFDEATNLLKKGELYPKAIVVDFPERGNDGNATELFQQKTPLQAMTYAKIRNFLEYMESEMPEIPVYVLMDKQEYNYLNLKKHLMEKGVSDIVAVSKSDGGLDGNVVEEILKNIERNTKILELQAIAHRFAREKKALSFVVSSNREYDEVVIRLKDFKVETLISGSDTDDLMTEDRMPSVTFNDYIGGESIKEEMKEFISFLRNPRKYREKQGEQPRGILLYGPPGTGKTFFAKATAHEAGVPFFAANGSGFVNKYAGSGPEAIRKLFAKARKYAPAIVFIDEIDAIGRKRTGESSAQSREETLNMLLSEMDGFETDAKNPVFVIAATNYGIDQHSQMALDPALIRRFNRTIYVDLPNQQERMDYFIYALGKHGIKFSETFMESIAKRSVGMNYGTINNVIEKALRDAKKAGKYVSKEILDDALETICYGEKVEWDRAYLERVAWHEVGHAYTSWKCGRTPEYITINARADFGGYVMHADAENKPLWTKKDIINQVKICLAGRMAEILRYGDEDGLSTGPAQDIVQAGQLLADYVYRYAMDDKIGMIYINDSKSLPFEVQQRIRELMKSLCDEIKEELLCEKETLQRFVDKLLEVNKLSSDEIEQLLNERD